MAADPKSQFQCLQTNPIVVVIVAEEITGSLYVSDQQIDLGVSTLKTQKLQTD